MRTSKRHQPTTLSFTALRIASKRPNAASQQPGLKQTLSSPCNVALLKAAGTMALSLMIVSLITQSSTTFAQTSPPPSLGEETKGVPAIDETTPVIKDGKKAAQKKNSSAVDGVFGKAHVTESRRENGQRYRIELEHSGGAKQYIEENDSDGKIESTGNDIEETPNLPKWKLGSW